MLGTSWAVSAVPHPRPIRRRLRRWHLGALLAAAAYAAAGTVVYHLVVPAFTSEPAAPSAADAADATAPQPVALKPQEALALKAVASRVQKGTYVVQTAGTVGGSGFVAWVKRKISFVVTARSLVAPALAAKTKTVYVKRGKHFWPARVIRTSKQSGTALLRVNVRLGHPLWTKPNRVAGLKAGRELVTVPAGKASYAAALLGKNGEGFTLPAQSAADVGAPVVTPDGLLAGIVTGTDGNVTRVAPLRGTCKRVRGGC